MNPIQLIQLSSCPRCRSKSYEVFKTHDCCYECNYSSVFEEESDVPSWAIVQPKEEIKLMEEEPEELSA